MEFEPWTRESALEVYPELEKSEARTVIVIVGQGRDYAEYLLNVFLLKLSSEEFGRLLHKDIENQREYDDIRIPDIHPREFGHIDQYLHMTKKWEFENLEDALLLLKAVTRFGLDHFNEIICKQVSLKLAQGAAILDASAACQAFSLFTHSNEYSIGLRATAMKYILENSGNIFTQNHFLDISAEDFGAILAQDDLVVDSELVALKAVLRWATNTLKKGKKRLTTESIRGAAQNLVERIRFTQMKKYEIECYVFPLGILTPEDMNCLGAWLDFSPYSTRDDHGFTGFGSNERYCRYLGERPRRYLKEFKTEDSLEGKTLTQIAEAARAEVFVTNYFAECERFNSQLDLSQLRQDLENAQKEAERFKTNIEKRMYALETANQSLTYKCATTVEKRKGEKAKGGTKRKSEEVCDSESSPKKVRRQPSTWVSVSGKYKK